MKIIKRIVFVPHGIRCSVNNVHIDSYTDSELQAQILLGIGMNSTDSTYTPHNAGNDVIELAERIKADRAIMAMNH